MCWNTNGLPSRAQKFLCRCEGAITLLSLQIFIVALILGGLALDVSNALTARTQLQIAADAAAHAALYTREFGTVDEAKLAALSIISATMPEDKYGEVLNKGDIEFGHWDRSAQTFHIDRASKDAVLVSTKRFATRGNPVRTFLLSLIGFSNWNVATGSVFETYFPPCLRAGFAANRGITLTGPAIFPQGFCLHTNGTFTMNVNNRFDAGSVLSLSDQRNIIMPAGGYDLNPGLKEAINESAYRMRLVNHLDMFIHSLQTPDSTYWRPYVTSHAPIIIGSKTDVGPATFMAGNVYQLNCTAGNRGFELGNDTVLMDVVLVTNCPLIIHASTTVQNAVIISTDTSDEAIVAEEGTTFGENDDCAPGGSVQILSKGGVDFSRGVVLSGTQIIAAGNVKLKSDDKGLIGSSVQTAGTLDLAVEGAVVSCGDALPTGNFELPYFRLAK